MPKLFQLLMLITSGLIGLIVLSVVVVYYLASRSLPNYDKTLRVLEVTAPVEIVRDNANVPHIFASESAPDTDVFFGLEYAHAQDRLW